MKTTNEKRAWRFTALDLIILVVLLAVIAAAVSLAVLGGVTLAAWMYQKKTKR